MKWKVITVLCAMMASLGLVACGVSETSTALSIKSKELESQEKNKQLMQEKLNDVQSKVLDRTNQIDATLK